MMDKDRFDLIIDGLDEEKLTLWETGFVESCMRGWEKFGHLTERMEEKLEELYQEKAK
jgi:hypothetical protein